MELFIKRFIDLLDELSPVSMVHTIIEQPLGAVVNDSYVKIHSRLDLIDEFSPYVEIELYPYDTNYIELLLAYTFPKNGIKINEENFINKIRIDQVATAEKVIPIDDPDNYFYEVFIVENLEIPEGNGAIDELVHQTIPKIQEWLSLGGYVEESGE